MHRIDSHPSLSLLSAAAFQESAAPAILARSIDELVAPIHHWAHLNDTQRGALADQLIALIEQHDPATTLHIVNSTSDSLPEQFRELGFLRELTICNMSNAPGIAPQISSLSGLQDLTLIAPQREQPAHLHTNFWEGDWEPLRHLDQLQHLSLDGYDVDSVPDWFTPENFPHLVSISITDSRLREVPATLLRFDDARVNLCGHQIENEDLPPAALRSSVGNVRLCLNDDLQLAERGPIRQMESMLLEAWHAGGPAPAHAEGLNWARSEVRERLVNAMRNIEGQPADQQLNEAVTYTILHLFGTRMDDSLQYTIHAALTRLSDRLAASRSNQFDIDIGISLAAPDRAGVATAAADTPQVSAQRALLSALAQWRCEGSHAPAHVQLWRNVSNPFHAEFDPSVVGFTQWLKALRATTDFRNFQEQLTQRVNTLLDSIGSTSNSGDDLDFRSVCLAAGAQTPSCEDRPGSILNDLEVAQLRWQVQRGQLEAPALISIGRQLMRAAMVEEIAARFAADAMTAISADFLFTDLQLATAVSTGHVTLLGELQRLMREVPEDTGGTVTRRTLQTSVDAMMAAVRAASTCPQRLLEIELRVTDIENVSDRAERRIARQLLAQLTEQIYEADPVRAFTHSLVEPLQALLEAASGAERPSGLNLTAEQRTAIADIINAAADAAATRDERMFRVAGQMERVDDLGIRLHFQTALRQRLDLPGQTMTMLWDNTTGIFPDHVDEAEAEVKARETADDSNAKVEFLADWPAWQAHLRREDPESYDSALTNLFEQHAAAMELTDSDNDVEVGLHVNSQGKVQVSMNAGPSSAELLERTQTALLAYQKARTDLFFDMTRSVIDKLSRAQRIDEPLEERSNGPANTIFLFAATELNSAWEELHGTPADSAMQLRRDELLNSLRSHLERAVENAEELSEPRAIVEIAATNLRLERAQEVELNEGAAMVESVLRTALDPATLDPLLLFAPNPPAAAEQQQPSTVAGVAERAGQLEDAVLASLLERVAFVRSI